MSGVVFKPDFLLKAVGTI